MGQSHPSTGSACLVALRSLLMPRLRLYQGQQEGSKRITKQQDPGLLAWQLLSKQVMRKGFVCLLLAVPST